ncbi:MAG: hypothetical protein ACM3SV_07860 [Betaproteobacteria bacterium]
MENQDKAAPQSDTVIDLPGNPIDRPGACQMAGVPATGIHSAGDRLLYGTPQPDGAAPATAAGQAREAGTRGRPAGRFIRNPLATVVLAAAAGFLLGRLLP